MEDYTDRMKEEQLENQILEQSLQAARFTQDCWPELREKAQNVLPANSESFEEILLCGCGDSHHAAVGLEMAFDVWSRRVVRAAPAMYASRYLIPRLRDRAPRCLVMGISVSGEVARTIEALQLAKSAGAYTLAFTSNPDSTLGKTADGCLWIELPSFSGPGLISYLASLLMGYAVCVALSEGEQRDALNANLEEIPSLMEPWVDSEVEAGNVFAKDMKREDGCVFIAGGSLFGTAMFSAAKAIESAGVHAWAQELEEWAHLEYFCEPAEMPTWFLTCAGRTESREMELLDAAQALGRRVHVSRWKGDVGWSRAAREALAPLVLWAGPAAFAAGLSEVLEEIPFRGFGGGRSAVEGGGASRIRSSKRFSTLRDVMP
jgi:glucosamine--fructose-6-phosphate aminotransferase (isomerizing)